MLKASVTEPGKFTLSPVKSSKIVVPKKLTPSEQREFMRQEYKRLSKNIDQVQFDTLDNESKYNYLICSRLFTETRKPGSSSLR